MSQNIAIWLTHAQVPCWQLDERQLATIRARIPDVRVESCGDEHAFRRALTRANIAIVWRFEESWLDGAPELEWIVTPAAGRDYFRVPDRAGLKVEYSSFHGPIIAETVAGMLLGHLRGLFRAQRLRELPWPRAELAASMRTLRSTQVGILGHGAIGREIGRTLRAVGARVLGFRRTPSAEPSPDERAPELPVTVLDRHLPSLDALVLALPRDATTDGILDAKRLALLPRTAIVVNVGRGNAIDERALVSALDRGELAAAFLDVFREEPLPAGSPLRSCENAFLFPHASAIAPEYLDLFIEEFVRKHRERYRTG